MPLLEREPHIHIEDGRDGQVLIHVRHYGRVPDLTREFSPEVLRQAVNKWRRTSREDRILKAAWGLSWTGYRLVQAHLIRERALAVEFKMQRKAELKAERASWSRRSTDAQQLDEREVAKTERAAYHQQRGDDGRERESSTARPMPTKDEAELAKDQSWLDALLSPLERPFEARPETLTERAQRELAQEKSRKPKISSSERTAMQRALAEREESLRDLVEFEPKRETATQRALRESKAERAEPQPDRDRDRSR